MKLYKSSIFLLFLLSVLMAPALQAQNMKYEKDSLGAVLQKAKKLGKPVFIHLAVPSVTLPAGVLPFTDGLEEPAVAKAYTEQFLNVLVKHNTPQANRLARQYGVTRYPTYLYLSPEGFLVHRNSTSTAFQQRYFNDIKAYKEKANSPHSLNFFNTEFQKGTRDPDFLLQFINARKKLELPPDLTLLEEYVSQLPVKAFEDFATVVSILEQGPVVDSKAYTFARYNKVMVDSVYKTVPYPELVQMNNKTIRNTMAAATEAKDRNLAHKGAVFAQNTWTKNRMQGLKAYHANMISFYRSTKDSANFLRETVQYYERHYMALPVDSVKKIMANELAARNQKNATAAKRPTTAPPAKAGETQYTTTYVTTSSAPSFLMELNNAAYSIYQTGTQNQDYLTKALFWSKRTVELEPNAANHDTLAHLLYKLNFFAEAEAMQQKAVDLGKKTNQPVNELVKSLQKIKDRTL